MIMNISQAKLDKMQLIQSYKPKKSQTHNKHKYGQDATASEFPSPAIDRFRSANKSFEHKREKMSNY